MSSATSRDLSDIPGAIGRRLAPMRFAPLDILAFYRVILVATTWKLWSTDFVALAELTDARVTVTLVPDSAERLAGSIHRNLFSSAAGVRTTQVVSGLLLLAEVRRPSRPRLLIGLLPLLALTAVSYRFSSTFYDFDFAICILLVLAVFWDFEPGRAKANRRVTPNATRVGRAVVLFIGLAYLLAGWSKLRFDPTWAWSVHVELVADAVTTWQNIPPSGVLAHTSGVITRLLELPGVSPFAGAVTIAAELTWVLSLVSRRVRQVVPATMAVVHLAIFLASGILFVIWPLAAGAIHIRWRSAPPLHTSTTEEQEDGVSTTGGGSAWWNVRPLLLSIVLVAVPVQVGRSAFPLARYDSFGWSYEDVTEPQTFYALAAPNGDGELAVIDHNHFGFLDSVSTSRVSALYRGVVQLETSSPEGAALNRSLICHLVAAVRPHGSNAWLLGPLALPAHIASTSRATFDARPERLHIVRLDWPDVTSDRTPELADLGAFTWCDAETTT